MAYIKDTYELGEYMAYEYKFVGRNGAKGEKGKREEKPPQSRWQGRTNGPGKRR